MYNKTTQELGNKKIIVISKAWLTQILKTKQQYQQTYVNTICKSIKHYHYLDHFPICQEANGVSPKKVHVQTTWNTTLQKITQFHADVITDQPESSKLSASTDTKLISSYAYSIA